MHRVGVCVGSIAHFGGCQSGDFHSVDDLRVKLLGHFEQQRDVGLSWNGAAQHGGVLDFDNLHLRLRCGRLDGLVELAGVGLDDDRDFTNPCFGSGKDFCFAQLCQMFKAFVSLSARFAEVQHRELKCRSSLSSSVQVRQLIFNAAHLQDG